MLETFGTRYLPNAYSNYQKTRETAKEREQILADNFPDGCPSDWEERALYEKVEKASTKAISEMFRRHDELCHFYLLHKAGAITEDELANIDSKKIVIMLPPESKCPSLYLASIADLPSPDQDFALRYLPDAWKERDRLRVLFDDGEELYNSMLNDAICLDATRSGCLFSILGERLDSIRYFVRSLDKEIKNNRLAHAVDEISSSELAEMDQELHEAGLKFRKELGVDGECWVSNCILAKVQTVIETVEAPCILKRKIVNNMVVIPGKHYMICKYEVSQEEWRTIMGMKELPKEMMPDNPVEGHTYEHCLTFINALNNTFSINVPHLRFRLPTEKEWLFARRAGCDEGKCCRRNDGIDINSSSVLSVAWLRENSQNHTHPVGTKSPNAFGLYDMIGNVNELVEEQYGKAFYMGGDYSLEARWVDSEDRLRCFEDKRWATDFGIRLCADLPEEMRQTEESGN